MLERGACPLGRFGLTEVRLDATWLLLPFLSWTLAVGYFPSNYPVFSAVVDWALGLSGALLLPAMILLHELGHLLAGRAAGAPPCCLLVSMVGDVLAPAAEPPRTQALVALAGPAFSLIVGGLTFWAALNVGPLSRPLEALLGYLSIVSLVLVAGHLVPVWPLDGGRLLEAVLIRAGLEAERARRVVVLLGALAGVGLIGVGAREIWLGGVLPGVWAMLVGAVLLVLAAAQLSAGNVRDAA